MFTRSPKHSSSSDKVSRPPISVEFLGLPGSGKSTLATEVIARLQTQGLTCPTLQDLNSLETALVNPKSSKSKALALVAAVVVLRKLSVSLLTYALGFYPPTLDALKHAAYALRTRYVEAQLAQTTYDVIVRDQGLMQGIWSIGLAHNSVPSLRLERLITRVLDSNTLFVFVSAEADLALARIRQRGSAQGRVDRMEPCQAMKTLTTHQETMRRIVDLVTALAPDRVLNVDSALSLCSSEVVKVANAVTRIVR